MEDLGEVAENIDEADLVIVKKLILNKNIITSIARGIRICSEHYLVDSIGDLKWRNVSWGL